MVGLLGRTLILFMWPLRKGFSLNIGTSLETLVRAPLYSLEQAVAGQQIPRIPASKNRLRFDTLISTKEDQEFDHSLWDQVLSSYVKDGCVNYSGIRADERFEKYLTQLEEAPVPKKPLDRLAYHINAYNALCVAFVVRNPNISSILDLSKKDLQIWDTPTVVKLGGVEISLNQIEHDRLRGEWDEPSIHACIVCASKSCPDLRDRAYFPKDLESTMKTQLNNWLQNELKGCFVDDSRVFLSRIFLWFEADFQSHGGVLPFVRNFRSDIPENPAIRYLNYDWSLNSS
mmetsp:Transcript_11895/g.17818  ORF Transcript_11895/g.17818 Transcript_11895/m.17818 type:complete len:287 (-) Transcript_11895:567-1427(-)|eukprot:CAMPEP_0197316908 /NCGR_PEP_ID=MMETSP0891-20130614/44784_1 /TAXON_ID=44058 ORGANISM="Aureoumbra lagunensis, Strain CCMP1510" /NCGR_SAMPLE_ID=MMETSP0891 /ASSEMBLY_ACC=CAM_ASM_000534 /LENGTH=286 /DNA_ID=CAMNT_0042806619 /DNA_START=29 /DNA_END=889 /DNA_ORIENTATION=-